MLYTQTCAHATYGKKWQPSGAFRELVQNCSEYEIVYKAPAWPTTDPDTYLGYIRFSGSEHGGKAELINRKTTI
ncbi:hypothetical protein PG993_001743 [Apiospora rasikravindrae]|uniref:Uncharacterized protein n=1 Tax=Apiospora rasikravindrae TaxID=990691 RepID=A0ABR1UC96_9PEZI